MESQFLHSNNCLEKRSLLIYQSLMFNFRFFSLGTNNQLHLLPIKVLMAHQSKKNHCKRRLHKLCTHVISLEVFFYFQKEIKSINYTLKTLSRAPATVLAGTLYLKQGSGVGGQDLFLLKKLGALYLKSNNVPLNTEASRTLLMFLWSLTKVNYQVCKKPVKQEHGTRLMESPCSLQVAASPRHGEGTAATKAQTLHRECLI